MCDKDRACPDPTIGCSPPTRDPMWVGLEEALNRLRNDPQPTPAKTQMLPGPTPQTLRFVEGLPEGYLLYVPNDALPAEWRDELINAIWGLPPETKPLPPDGAQCHGLKECVRCGSYFGNQHTCSVDGVTRKGPWQGVGICDTGSCCNDDTPKEGT